MRWAALGLASAASAFWVFFWLLGAFAEGEGRWLRGGVAFGLLAASLAGRRPLLAFALTALPYLLAGGYLVISRPKEEEL